MIQIASEFLLNNILLAMDSPLAGLLDILPNWAYLEGFLFNYVMTRQMNVASLFPPAPISWLLRHSVSLAQRSAAQLNPAQASLAQFRSVQFSSAQPSLTQPNPFQLSSVQFGSLQINSAQPSSAQLSSAHLSSDQFSSAQPKAFQLILAQLGSPQFNLDQLSLAQLRSILVRDTGVSFFRKFFSVRFNLGNHPFEPQQSSAFQLN